MRKLVVLFVISLIYISLFIGCGSSIEMSDRLNCTFDDGTELYLKIPKGWSISETRLGDNLYGFNINSDSSKNDPKKDVYDENGVVIDIMNPETAEIEIDYSKCKLYGDYWVEPIYKDGKLWAAGIHIDKNKIIVFGFDHLPNNEFTPEVEAILSSIKVSNPPLNRDKYKKNPIGFALLTTNT